VSGHTPGPWQIGRGPVTGQVCVWGPGDPDATAEWICGQIDNNGTSPHCEANARLIAAAPELLEASQNLLASIDQTDPAQWGCSTVAYAELLEAIAKATGK